MMAALVGGSATAKPLPDATYSNLCNRVVFPNGSSNSSSPTPGDVSSSEFALNNNNNNNNNNNSESATNNKCVTNAAAAYATPLQSPFKEIKSLDRLSSSSASLSSQNVSLTDDQSRLSSTSTTPVDVKTEDLIGVTILTQLQELDLAIKEREANKVDGRKTRWLEHRKAVGESSKKSPESAGKRRTGGGRKRKSLEPVSDGGVSSEKSSPSPTVRRNLRAPLAAAAVSSPESSIKDSKNNTPEPGTMKMEVAEPLVGSVEPSNVLETMKQQFLQDTIRDGNPDTARLTTAQTSTGGEEPPVATHANNTEKKKYRKVKEVVEPTLQIGKKKLGRPPKNMQKHSVQTKLPKRTHVMKHLKIKITNMKKKAQPTTETATKDFNISNFFIKQKTRGLREVRKPEIDTPVDSDETVGSPVVSAPLRISETPKCSLVTATEKVVSSKSTHINKKSFPVKLSAKLSFEKKNSKCSTPVASPLNDSVESDIKVKVEDVSADGGIKFTASSADVEVLDTSNSAEMLDSATTTCSDLNITTSSTVITPTGRPRGRPRGSTKKRKRLPESGSSSPSPKCPKKTTVVAEVHNSMNGEPQAVASAAPVTAGAVVAVPKIPGRKRKANSTVIALKPVDDTSKPVSKESPAKNAKESEVVNKSTLLLDAMKEQFLSNVNNTSVSSVDTAVDGKVLPSKSAEKLTEKSVSNPPSPRVTSPVKPVKEGQLLIVNQLLRAASCPSVVPEQAAILAPTPVILSRSADSGGEGLALVVSATRFITNGPLPQATVSSNGPVNVTPYPVPEKTSAFRRKNGSPPVKLIRTNLNKSTEASSGTTQDQTEKHEMVVLDKDQTGEQSTAVNSGAGPKVTSPKRKSPPSPVTATVAEAVVLQPGIEDPHFRAKSPTGSDCDNNNSEIQITKTVISDTKSVDEKVTASNKDKPTEVVEKPKKAPRFLKDLFLDEGVQKMLGSMEEESLINLENGSIVPSDPMMHKLRPKRPPMHAMAISPEPDFEPYAAPSNSHKRKRKQELDALFIDEGALNLLTSVEEKSRRSGLGLLEEPHSKQSVTSINSVSEVIQSVVKSVELQQQQLHPEVVFIKEKRKPGRPPMKQKQISQPQRPKPSSPSCPVIDIDQENSHHQKKVKQDGSVLIVGTYNKADAAANSLAFNGHLVHHNRSPSVAIPVSTNQSLITSKTGVIGPSSSVVIQSTSHNRAPASTASGAIAIPSKQVVVSSNSSSTAIVGLLTPGQTSPMKMRRADLPTSPTASSLDSLVRSLVESGPGKRTVCASSVACVPHRMPQDPTNMRAMRHVLPVVDGSSSLRHSQRSSSRHSLTDSCSSNFRDIVLRRMNNFVHVIMAPQTTKIKNSLNSRVLRELCMALENFRNDPNVRLVLLTSNGSSFCQGVDFTALLHSNLDTRHNNAHNLTRAIQDFVRTLAHFPKPVIAGVNGDAAGLGVTILPLFDMVFASDSAEFFLPYSKLGQVPEGGATHTFPVIMGKLQSTRLFMGRKFSASEAMSLGLVSECLWPASFQEALLPKVALLATQSAQSMEATKMLVNHSLFAKLESSVENECHILMRQWISPQFEALSRRFLETHAPLMQKPVSLPL